MAYLTFNKFPVNESIGTMLTQLGQGIKHLFNTDNWTSNRAACNNYLNAKREYFDELFVITPRLKDLLLKWIKKIPGAFYLKPNEMDQFLGTLEGQHSITSDGYGNTYSQDVNITKEYGLQLKARDTNMKNRITNTTCTYKLQDGNKCYLLFFTFDSDDISVAQVLTKNKYGNTMLANGFDIVEIPEWAGVNPKEYVR